MLRTFSTLWGAVAVCLYEETVGKDAEWFVRHNEREGDLLQA